MTNNSRAEHDAFIDFWNALGRALNDAIAANVPRNDIASVMHDLACFLEEGELLAKSVERGKMTRLGRTFTKGRRPGSGSPIRRAVARLLRTDRTLKPRTLWAMLADDPPRGWTFRANRLGKYIEGPRASDGMRYARFQNIAKEERDKLNK